MRKVEDYFIELCEYIKKNGSGRLDCTGNLEGMEFDVLIVGRLKFDPSTPLPSPTWFEFEEQDRRNREPKDRFKKAFDTLYDRGMFGRNRG